VCVPKVAGYKVATCPTRAQALSIHVLYCTVPRRSKDVVCMACSSWNNLKYLCGTVKLLSCHIDGTLGEVGSSEEGTTFDAFLT